MRRSFWRATKAELKSGAVAQYDVLRSQEEVAGRQQVLLAAENTFSQDAQSLKAKISKSFNEELATVEIAPSDRLPEPHPEDVPALAEALREAASHRPEIEQAELNLRNQESLIQATRNALLPSLQVFASYSLAGLGGALRPTFTNIFQNDLPQHLLRRDARYPHSQPSPPRPTPPGRCWNNGSCK